MISIILLILKIIGMLLLAILGLLIVISLFLLFIPLTYYIDGEIHNDIKTLRISGKAIWLLGIARAIFEYEYPDLYWKASALWFKITSEDEAEIDEMSETVPDNTIVKPGDTKSKDTTAENVKENVKENIKENVKEKEIKQQKLETVKSKADSKKKVKTKSKLTSKSKKKKKQKEKKDFAQTIRQIYDTIIMIREKKEMTLEFLNDSSTQHTWQKLKHELIYLWKHAKPKVFRIDGELGMEDPALTGKILAGMSVLYPFYGNAIHITPYFEEARYEGKFLIKGRFNLYLFVKIGTVLILDKQVMYTYKEIRKFWE